MTPREVVLHLLWRADSDLEVRDSYLDDAPEWARYDGSAEAYALAAELLERSLRSNP